MKRLLLSVIVLLSVNITFAQFEKKIASSNEDIQNEKKKDNPKTWISRANLFQDIYDEPTKGIWAGMSQTEVNLILRDQKSIGNEIASIGGVDYTVIVYSDKKLYFDQNGALAFWVITKELAEKPLQTAYDAYNEAIKVDPKQGAGNKKIKEGLIRLSNQFKTEGSNSYSLEQYEEALKNFQLSLSSSSNPLVGQTDSIIIYYAGVAASLAKNYTVAEELFNQAIKIGYTHNGDTYVMLSEVLRENGKKEAALNTLQAALKNYPDNKQVLLSLIDFYLREGDDPKKVLPLIEQAKENQPDNANLYYAEGMLYEKISETSKDPQDMNKAIEAYKKAIEIAPEYFFGHYGLAVAYFNRAANYYNEANNTPPSKNDEYERLLKLADEQFELALPAMLKAYELNPNEKSVIQSLKDIYFRFRTKGKEYQENYDKFNNMLQSM